MTELSGARASATGGEGTVGSAQVDQLPRRGVSGIRALDDSARRCQENPASASRGGRDPATAIGLVDRDDLMSQWRVAVVIVTYNSARLLPDVLDSLPAAAGACVLDPVLVVDNASTDGVEDLVRGRSGVRFVQLGRNAGYAAGVNAGVRQAGDVNAVLVLNPDIRLAPGCVERLAQLLRRSGTGIAVPRLVAPGGMLQPSLRRAPRVRSAFAEAVLGGALAGRGGLGEVVVDPAVYEAETDADWATGAAMLISSDCLRATGPWDESFLLYCEETDFALRARDAGFRLRYTPAARAVHIGGESGVSPFLWSLLTINRVQLFRRRNNGFATAVFYLGVVLNEAIRAVAGRRVSRAALAALLLPSRRPTTLPQP